MWGAVLVRRVKGHVLEEFIFVEKGETENFGGNSRSGVKRIGIRLYRLVTC